MTIYHMSCTAQMGPPTNPWAVVDPQLRVYGVSGLRVIDASISKYQYIFNSRLRSIEIKKSTNINNFPLNFLVPTITSGNIHAPTVMIAEKGADLIKELWLQEEVVRAERAAESVASPKKINDLANVTIAA